MAIGADRGILLKTTARSGIAQATAAAIVDAVRGEEPFDLILFGNESADAGNYQVGIRVAYALGLPVVTGLKKIEVQGDRVRCERDVGGARDVYEVPLPAVLTALEGLNLPRYPSVPGRLRAKSKPRRRSSSRRARSRSSRSCGSSCRRARASRRRSSARAPTRRRESSRSCCSSASRERRSRHARLGRRPRAQRSASLREQLAAGRLTLEEFTRADDRCVPRRRRGRARRARARSAGGRRPRSSRAGARRAGSLVAIFGSTERSGRIRAGRRVVCLTLFGNVDLDLRQATLEGDAITILAIAMFGAIDVYVPRGRRGRADTASRSSATRARTATTAPRGPARRSCGCARWPSSPGIDIWRVPLAWASRTLGDVIRGIEKGEHEELGCRRAERPPLRRAGRRAVAPGARARAAARRRASGLDRRRLRTRSLGRGDRCAADGADAIVAAGSDRGNELLAHVAARLDQPFAANVTAIDGDVVTRVRWGGSLLEEARLHGSPRILSVAPHTQPAAEPSPVEQLDASTPTAPSRVLETVVGVERRRLAARREGRRQRRPRRRLVGGVRDHRGARRPARRRGRLLARRHVAPAGARTPTRSARRARRSRRISTSRAASAARRSTSPARRARRRSSRSTPIPRRRSSRAPTTP